MIMLVQLFDLVEVELCDNVSTTSAGGGRVV